MYKDKVVVGDVTANRTVQFAGYNNTNPSFYQLWSNNSNGDLMYKRQSGTIINLTSAPNNYSVNLCWDGETNPNKIMNIPFWSTGIATPSAVEIPFKVGASTTEQQAQALVMIQKFGEFVIGADNDMWFDGIGMSTNQIMRSSGNFPSGNSNSQYLPNITSAGDEDQYANGSGSPSEYFRLIIGARGSTMYFCTVSVVYAGTASSLGEVASGFGMRFVNSSNSWDTFGSSNYPQINATTSWTTSGTPSTANNVVDSGHPVAWLNIARLTLQ